MTEQEFTTEELQNEEWRLIPSMMGYFSASSLGRIRREDSHIKAHRGLIMSPALNRSYAIIGVCFENKRRTKTVHGLIAETFLGPRPAKEYVNHKDANKRNNRASNLEYTTPKGNSEHAKANGLTPKGDRQGLRKHPERVARGMRAFNAKLTDGQVLAMRAEYDTGDTSTPKLGRKYGVSTHTAWSIVKRKRWTHI